MGVEKRVGLPVSSNDYAVRNIEAIRVCDMRKEFMKDRNPGKLKWMRVSYDLQGDVWHRVTDPGEVTFEVRYRSTTEGRVTMFVSFPLHTYPRTDLVPISRTEIDYWE